MPPYRSPAGISINPDQQAITVDTPARTGRAALFIDGLHFKQTTEAESCTTFTWCSAMPSATMGPVFVEVVP